MPPPWPCNNKGVNSSSFFLCSKRNALYSLTGEEKHGKIKKIQRFRWILKYVIQPDTRISGILETCKVPRIAAGRIISLSWQTPIREEEELFTGYFTIEI